MDMSNACIFCLNPPSEAPLSDEHVISMSLGGNLVLPQAACRDCNSALGHMLEGPLVNGLEYFRWAFGIERRDGQVPNTQWQTTIEGKTVAFVVDKNGHTRFEPILLMKRTHPDGRTEVVYRCQREADARRVERRLRRRHPEVTLEPTGPNQRGDVEGEYTGSLAFLATEPVLRCVAKYGYTYAIHVRGSDFAVREELQPLRDWIRPGKDMPPGCCFLIGSRRLLRQLGKSPPRHRIMVVGNGRQRALYAFVGILGLFWYYVILCEQYAGPDWFSLHEFDPIERTAVEQPLALYGFPEVDLQELKEATEGQRVKVAREAFVRGIWVYNRLCAGGGLPPRPGGTPGPIQPA